ncbi:MULTISPECIES: hypothetical protein [Acinetobacter]|uniref:hypothetical protein n=1 Tax=Acinetobacter TaxID=469 RepID=UPI00125EEBAC|nr:MULTISPECIES: hypothetical protein [Acinetobacter]MDR6543909.1 ABC-type multidrug transport system fused ATPase/permease subunit [Acinetobacter bereziniae]BCX75223.1 hypothetical protein TOL5_34230 [Acinetobacter sp. Tol 5]
MKFTFFLIQKIKMLVDNSGFIAKFIIGIGIFFILLYFWHIDYFPTDLSLGDGLLFFLITIKFLLIYAFFLSSNYALGGILIFVLKMVRNFFKVLFSLRERLSKGLIDLIFLNLDLRKILKKISNNFIKFLFYIFGFAYALIFYSGKSINILVMLFLSILLKVFIDKFIEDLKNNNNQLDKIRSNEKNIKLSMMLLYILLVPSSVYVFYVEKSNNIFINIALGSVREDERNSLIFIKKEFKDFFPDSKIGDKKGEYIELEGGEILLKGVGKNALIQYTTKTKDQNGKDVKIKIKVEVPNEALLIVRRAQY